MAVVRQLVHRLAQRHAGLLEPPLPEEQHSLEAGGLIRRAAAEIALDLGRLILQPVGVAEVTAEGGELGLAAEQLHSRRRADAELVHQLAQQRLGLGHRKRRRDRRLDE